MATGSRLKCSDAVFMRASAASTPSTVPEITTWVGALWLATTTSLRPRDSSWASTSSIVAETAHIAPGNLLASAISSPRRRATRSISASLNTPAACRAVISPKLWPATASGFRPSLRMSASSERLAKPMAGCAHSVDRSRSSSARRSVSLKRGMEKTT